MYIDIRFYFVRTAVENTNSMPADIFAKSLSCQKHNKILLNSGHIKRG